MGWQKKSSEDKWKVLHGGRNYLKHSYSGMSSKMTCNWEKKRQRKLCEQLLQTSAMLAAAVTKANEMY